MQVQAGGIVLAQAFRQSTLVLVLHAFLLSGCGSALLEPDDLTTGTIAPRESSSARPAQISPRNEPYVDMSDADATRARRGGTFKGTGKLIAAPTSRRADTDPVASGTSAGADGVTLNLVDVEIGQAAKTVLADLLSLNYVIDPTVTGAITIQTTRPVPLSTLTDIFDAVLRANGAAIVDDGSGVFKIVPASQVRRSMPSLRLPGETRRRHKLGVTHQVVPLRYVSVTEMERILRSVGPADAILYADQSRNLLILSGTRKELEASLEAIEIFDVDWMKGMSFALFPVQTSDPEAIAAELDTISQPRRPVERTISCGSFQTPA